MCLSVGNLQTVHEENDSFIFASNLKGHLKALIEENFKDHQEYVFRDPILFGDYRTALDEAEPRLYEDIQDFDAAKALFQEVRFSLK